MGNVFKKTVTRPLPPNAEIITRQGVRLARWRDGKGKTRTAPVTTGKDGADRIRDESGTYVARYRDGNGLVVEVSTGCRDKTAAQSVLADLERKPSECGPACSPPPKPGPPSTWRRRSASTSPTTSRVSKRAGRARNMSPKRGECSVKCSRDAGSTPSPILSRRQSSNGSTSDDRKGHRRAPATSK